MFGQIVRGLLGLVVAAVGVLMVRQAASNATAERSLFKSLKWPAPERYWVIRRWSYAFAGIFVVVVGIVVGIGGGS
jgi:uncharacterized membrane protein YfcA